MKALSLVGATGLAAIALALPHGAGTAIQRVGHVRVVVRGFGTVTIGRQVCRSRCTWSFRRGAVVRPSAQPGMGTLFGGWRGACSGRSGCAVRIPSRRAVQARFAPIRRLVSWSRHTSCTPVRTTIPEILGSEESQAHGATESGGRFQPHFRGGGQQHQLNPACEIGGTPTFVEVDDVYISRAPNRSSDHDDSTNLTDPNRPDIPNPSMKMIHVEIDGTWIDAHVAPPLWPTKLGTRLDVQGFVFWDPAHLGDAWHGYSGWELHPVAAWRPAAS
jgi:hypothetical protein